MTLPSPRVLASVSFGICALLAAGFWAIYLFVGNPPAVTAMDQLNQAFAFPMTPASRFLLWLAVFLATSMCLSLAYLSPLSRSKTGAMILLIMSIAQAITAAVILAVPEALIFSVPVVWSFASWRQSRIR